MKITKLMKLFSILAIVSIFLAACMPYQPAKKVVESSEVNNETAAECTDDKCPINTETATSNTTTDDAFKQEFDRLKKIVSGEDVVKPTETTVTPVETKLIETKNETKTETEVLKTPVDNEVIYSKDSGILTVIEGNLVDLKIKASDADNDNLIYTYTAPMNSSGQWQTKKGDAGKYSTFITVSDGKSKVAQRVTIVVKIPNNPPVIKPIADITVNEGETVKIKPEVTDPDGDSFTMKYTGWMTSDTKLTDYNNAGVYTVKVTATDTKGESTSQDVKVTVLDVNRPPKFCLEGVTC